MRTIKNTFSLLIISLLCVTSFAQQVPRYSQYVMNGFLLNPSFAGRDGYTSITLTAREQWVGLSDAPSTYALSVQTRLLKDSYISKSTSVRRKTVRPTKGGNVGLGGYIFNDDNGIMRRTGLQLTYAYHISIGQTRGYPNNLAFGLSFSGYQYFIDLDGQIFDTNDPLLNNYDRSVFIPDFNFGASWTTANYYVGFSMTNLTRGALMFADTTDVQRNELGHFFLTGGYKFQLTPDWTIEPSAFIRSSDMMFKSVQMDLTARVYYQNDYWAGISLRTGDAVIAMAGLKYDRFYFAYAVDFTLTELRRRSYGTHEITFAVKFGESARRYRWINAY